MSLHFWLKALSRRILFFVNLYVSDSSFIYISYGIHVQYLLFI